MNKLKLALTVAGIGGSLGILISDWLWVGLPMSLDLLQDLLICLCGGLLGYSLLGKSSQKSQNTDPLHTENLPNQLLKEENQQLNEKIKTLEAALEKALQQ